MGRAPCCDKANVKKGPWSPEEDAKLKEYIEKYGTGGNWIALPQKAGLRRCGKSCRLRWLNYLRPNIKHGEFSDTEDAIICNLYATIGSRWSIIAAQLPGRTDNDIKNYWNTKLKKKLMTMAANNNINFTPQHPSHQSKYRTNHHHFQLMQQPSITTSTGGFHLYPSSASSLLMSPELSSSSPCHNNNTSSISFYNSPTAAAAAMTTSAQQLSFPGFDHSSFLSSSSSSCLSTTSASTMLQQTTAAAEASAVQFQDQDVGYNGHSFNPSNNYMVFGNAPEASCSSSDESCSNNIHDHNDNGAVAPSSTTTNGSEQQAINFLRWYSGSSNSSSYPYNIGLVEEEEELEQKAILSSNGLDLVSEKTQNSNLTSGIWSEAAAGAGTITTSQLMDYGLEEIKQLISATNSNNLTTTTTACSSINGTVCSDSATGLLLASNNNDVINHNNSWYYFDENKTAAAGEGVLMTYY